MNVREAILEALKFKSEGDIFSLLDLTKQVSELLGRWITDGTISRYLRFFNEGFFDRHGIIFRYEVVKNGVYRIIQKENLKKVYEKTTLF